MVRGRARRARARGGVIIVATKRQDWTTPPGVFFGLHLEFSFTVDAAAEAHNALLSRFWTVEQDALRQDWTGQCVFCNPPWSRIPEFLERGRQFAQVATSVFLLPASVDTAWFHDIAYYAWKDLFRGRVSFVAPEGVKQSTPPTGTMLAVFGPGWMPTGLGFGRSRNNKTGAVIVPSGVAR